MEYIWKPFFAFEHKLASPAIVLWRYVIIAWLTAVYHGRAHGFDTMDAAIAGAYGCFFWPIYWFVETVRFFI